MAKMPKPRRPEDYERVPSTLRNLRGRPGGAVDPEVAEAIDQCLRIQDVIEELPESTKAKSPDFFESVGGKAAAIAQDVHDKGRVTTGQKRALSNMEAGVRKWVH